MQSEAIDKLKPFINEGNEQKFMDDFLKNLDTKIMKRLQNTSPD